MKKAFILLATLISLSGWAIAGDGVIELKGSYFTPSDKDFKDIYGSGLMYGTELTFGVWKNLDIWIGISYFSKSGQLTLTEEETSFKMTPISGGVKYRLSTGTVKFYGGLGLSYFTSKESNVIGDVTKNGLGYIVKVGSYVKVISRLVIDLYIDYSYCKIKPPDFGVNIGGIAAGIGLGYEL